MEPEVFTKALGHNVRAERLGGSPSRKMYLLLIRDALACVVASLVFFAVLSMELLAGARGYTQGEALRSKGQKGAVLLLHRYAHSRSEPEYRQYLDAIRVPAACREIGIFSSTDEPGDGSEGTRRQDSFPI